MPRSRRPARRRCGQGAPKPLGPAVARRLRGYLRSWPEAASRRWIGTSQTAKPITTTSSPRGDGGQRAAPLAGMAKPKVEIGGRQAAPTGAVYTRHPSDPSSRKTLGWLSAYLRRWRR
jgi:hypothetical protein